METALASQDCLHSAEEAQLRYVSDDQPGYRRRRAGRGFCFCDTHGERITDPKILNRIKALVIPPAWTNVWVCPHPRGHIQVTARDAKGRKQYRYHPEWQEVRDKEKFTRTLAFARALPALRKAVARDMAAAPLERRTVLATVVRLLETTLIRIGNREYAEQNKSFGLTTLRNRHVAVNGAKLAFDFVGKSGKRHMVELTDRRAAHVVKQLQDLPGQELFQYVGEDGDRRIIGSADVNDYLRRLSGDDFTAKDFRTWAGTVLAAWALCEFEKIDSKAAARRNITAAVKKVAGQLGNTPAVCRSSYIHPEILNSYLDGSLLDNLKREIKETLRDELNGLSAEEAAVFVLLLNRLETEAKD